MVSAVGMAGGGCFAFKRASRPSGGKKNMEPELPVAVREAVDKEAQGTRRARRSMSKRWRAAWPGGSVSSPYEDIIMCYECVAKVLRRCYKGVLKVLQRCSKSVLCSYLDRRWDVQEERSRP
jgi:hypothetical protein